MWGLNGDGKSLVFLQKSVRYPHFFSAGFSRRRSSRVRVRCIGIQISLRRLSFFGRRIDGGR